MSRYAYVEFLEVEAVQNAILLSESELHNRPLKVTLSPWLIILLTSFFVSNMHHMDNLRSFPDQWLTEGRFLFHNGSVSGVYSYHSSLFYFLEVYILV